MLKNIYDKDLQREQDHPDQLFFNQLSLVGLTKENLKFLLATTISGVLSGAFFMFSSQAGYKGMTLICQTLSQNCQPDNLHYMYKLAISIIPGVTAAIVAFMSGFEFVDTLIGSIYRHLRQKPKDIIKVMLITGCCLLTAMSLMNAATSIINEPNLFNLTTSPETFAQLLYVTLYIWGNYGVALALDMGACSKLLELTDYSDPVPTLNNMIAWMKNNPLSADTLAGLKQHGFFNKPQTKSDKYDIPLISMMV